MEKASLPTNVCTTVALMVRSVVTGHLMQLYIFSWTFRGMQLLDGLEFGRASACVCVRAHMCVYVCVRARACAFVCAFMHTGFMCTYMWLCVFVSVCM